jgi:hypothetical protein
MYIRFGFLQNSSSRKINAKSFSDGTNERRCLIISKNNHLDWSIVLEKPPNIHKKKGIIVEFRYLLLFECRYIINIYLSVYIIIYLNLIYTCLMAYFL